ncbi:MAG: hydroxymethylbilane synthase [Alphaproteobacteria bacterium]|nr:hydroxymethylbilane synthase [Alphaproteobacteria bacterium]
MTIRIGTRGSKLAIIQAELVKKELLSVDSSLDIEIIKITTTGDKEKIADLSKIGGKALFLKEIEEALLSQEVDIAVHSLKDVPFVIPNSLKIAAVLKREDVRDVFISKDGKTIKDQKQGAVIGTSSMRRAVQILNIRPDLQVVPFRGNIDSRIRKVVEGEVDGTILALAGLKRTNLYNENYEILDVDKMIPAVGQGAICIECSEDNKTLLSLLEKINHKETEILVSAERGFLETIEGNCRTPMGAFAEFSGHQVRLTCFLAKEELNKIVIKDGLGEKNSAYALGQKLAQQILSEI